MSKRIWRGGMIGAGAWSGVQLKAWARVPNAHIVALCDRHPDRRDPTADRFGISHCFDDLESMLDALPLDFVDICTRPYSHDSLVRLAAGRGLPVLCQKPFCTNLQEAADLVRFCDRLPQRLMVNENYRWQAWFRQARQLLDSNAIGQPFLARIIRRVRFTVPIFDHEQAYFSEMSRLITYEVGVHFLDTIRFLFGEPASVYARMHRISPHVKGEDVELLVAAYPNMTAVIDHSWASVPVPGLDRPGDDDSGVPRLEIDGTRGTLCLACDGRMTLTSDTGRQQWRFPKNTMDASCVAAQQHFIDCLESGEDFETSGAETLKTMALVYAAYLSANEGRKVNPGRLLDSAVAHDPQEHSGHGRPRS